MSNRHRKSEGPIAGAVGAAISRVHRRDAIYELFLEELGRLRESNADAVLVHRGELDVYGELRARLSPAERDLFLQGLLLELKGTADAGRQRLREVIRSHLALIEDLSTPRTR